MSINTLKVSLSGISYNEIKTSSMIRWTSENTVNSIPYAQCFVVLWLGNISTLRPEVKDVLHRRHFSCFSWIVIIVLGAVGSDAYTYYNVNPDLWPRVAPSGHDNLITHSGFIQSILVYSPDEFTGNGSIEKSYPCHWSNLVGYLLNLPALNHVKSTKKPRTVGYLPVLLVL